MYGVTDLGGITIVPIQLDSGDDPSGQDSVQQVASAVLNPEQQPPEHQISMQTAADAISHSRIIRPAAQQTWWQSVKDCFDRTFWCCPCSDQFADRASERRVSRMSPMTTFWHD